MKKRMTQQEINQNQEEKSEYERLALDILARKRDIYFTNDLTDEMGIARSTFYNNNLDKLDSIKNAILHNKRNVKRGLRNKWFNSDNATTQVALYKLLADEDELSRLNNNVDVSLNGKNLNIVVSDDKTKEAVEDL